MKIPMKDEDKSVTYTCNIRTNMCDTAKIAHFLHDRGEGGLKTKSRVISKAIQILANGIPEEYNVETNIDALRILSELGYGYSEKKGTRHYKQLMAEINLERESHSYNNIVKELIQENSESLPITPIIDSKESQSVKTLRKGLAEGAPLVE